MKKIITFLSLVLFANSGLANTMPNAAPSALDLDKLEQQEERYQDLLSAADRNDVYADTSRWSSYVVGGGSFIYAFATLEETRSGEYTFSEDGRIAFYAGLAVFAAGYLAGQYFDNEASNLRSEASNISQGLSYIPENNEFVYTVTFKF
ncbi:hypothetical protein LZU85_06180 [Vibrio sp. IRLE0018]|uniref:hypothetical protein n=1 Tax=Vibrio floridensis TaxID=2908007 RepID=UPI001F1C9C72|nr:hypothetical protein [Vibrio floridensis]MCF8778381.1 hypothetical protein [Vibrio floridensis]